MPAASKTVNRPTKGHGVTSHKVNKPSLPKTIKQRLLIADAAEIYQTERSRVYTVICIAFVGVTLIGLGAGLIVYARGLSISDLIVIGAIGIFIGFVSLIVAMSFLVKPILDRRHRNRVAALSRKEMLNNIPEGYLYGRPHDVNLYDVKFHPQPANSELYPTQDVYGKADAGSIPLKVAYPSDSDKSPTYDVEVNENELETSHNIL